MDVQHNSVKKTIEQINKMCKASGDNINLLKKWGETLNYVSCFSLHFFRALAASCVLYNRTEHSQGFSIC